MIEVSDEFIREYRLRGHHIDALNRQVRHLIVERDAARAELAIAQQRTADAESKPDRPPEEPRETTRSDSVPCGNPNTHCGRLGGSSRCLGCTDDEPSLTGRVLRDAGKTDREMASDD